MRCKFLFSILLLMLISGCIYSHTVQPLTVNMHRTPMTEVEKYTTARMVGLPHPFSMDLAAWGSAAIGDVARKQGIKEIYFADLEILTILRIWNEYTVHVYGK